MLPSPISSQAGSVHISVAIFLLPFQIASTVTNQAHLFFGAIKMKISYTSLLVLSLVHGMTAVEAETHKTRAQLLKEGLETDILDARELVSPGPP